MTATILPFPPQRRALVSAAVKAMFQASVASEWGDREAEAALIRKANALQDAIAALPSSAPEPPEAA